MGIGNQPSNEVQGKVSGAAMPRVLDLRDVLELIGDSFDDKALTE